MRIIETITDIVEAKPIAVSVLENIGSVPTYHESYKVRHPLASYNTSLASVSKRILKVIEILEKEQSERNFDKKKKDTWDEGLLEATDHMLDALMEHMEDCTGVLRSFFPKGDHRFKIILKNYKKSVAPYRDHIGKIVNYIKHNQGRLRSISFSWSGGSSIGYFVEGPTSNGGLGPVGEIHPDESSAFSYYRDIPFHVANIYAVSRRLAVALKEVHNELIPVPQKTSGDKQSDLSIVIKKVAKYPRIYFDDEIKKGVPFIKETSRSFKIDYPSKQLKPKKIPANAQVSTSFRGDGYTKTYVLPYYAPKS